MAKIHNTFSFVGEFKLLTDKEDKSKKVGMKEVTPKDPKSNWRGRELSFLLILDMQSQICKLFGGADVKGSIKTFSANKDANGKSATLEIPFSKRLDPEIVKNVAGFKKIKILDKEFISEYDAVEYVNKNLALFEGKKIKATGSVKFDLYEGKIYPKFMVNALYLANEKDKDGFNGQLALFLTGDVIDATYIKKGKIDIDKVVEDKKLDLAIYVEEYNSDKETNKTRKFNYIPMPVFLNIGDKFDKTNKAHTQKFEYLVDTLIPKNKDKVYEMGYGVRFFRGSEEQAITFDELSQHEKRKIEMGFVTMEELVKQKQGMQEKKTEIQLKLEFNPKYVEGVEETTLTEDDLSIVPIVDEEAGSAPVADIEPIEDSDLF